jgi:cytochrome c oxidase assembly protein subunit 11
LAIGGALSVMIALVVGSVPLYRLMCQVVGLNGTPKIAAAAPDAPADARVIEVRFDGNVMKGLPWRFAPNQKVMQVRLGEPNIASFTAANTGNETITGTASYNVSPAKAAIYVNKIQCFCFSDQKLAAGQSVEMPIQFYVDPKIATDPDTQEVTSITLSYSFFRTPQRNEGAS